MISIITASYNSSKTIEDTLISVLNQTYLEFEYIIIDGNSTDETLKIIEAYKPKFKEKKILFKVVSESDEGIYDAWNKGIMIAKGKWIGFLGSDDRYYENALKAYALLANMNNKIDYISSKVEVVSNKKVMKTIVGQWKWKTFKKYMNVAHVGSLHSSEYFKKYGLFNIDYKIAGDYEMLLRANDSLNYLFLDEITVEMDMGGISNNFIYQTLLETRRAKINTAKLNKFTTTIYFFWALFKATLKRF